MGQELFLTLILSVCTKTNDLNIPPDTVTTKRLECMKTLTECGKVGLHYLELNSFLSKCYKEIKR